MPFSFDAERSSARQGHRTRHPPAAGGAVFLEQADGAAGVGTHLIHQRLLAIQFLDDDERKNDVVLLEAKERTGICQEHAGVEYVGSPFFTRAHKGQACRLSHANQGSIAGMADSRSQTASEIADLTRDRPSAICHPHSHLPSAIPRSPSPTAIRRQRRAPCTVARCAPR